MVCSTRAASKVLDVTGPRPFAVSAAATFGSRVSSTSVGRRLPRTAGTISCSISPAAFSGCRTSMPR
jgi:hypothetical protein